VDSYLAPAELSLITSRLATAHIPAKLVDFRSVFYSFRQRCDKVRIRIRQPSNFEHFQQNQNWTNV